MNASNLKKMPVVEVLRLETSDGSGPYSAPGFSYRNWTERAHDESDGHPLPPPEFERDQEIFGLRLLFGFVDEHQLNNWFTQEELANLEGLDCHVRRVKGRIIGSDGFQCWFIRELEASM